MESQINNLVVVPDGKASDPVTVTDSLKVDGAPMDGVQVVADVELGRKRRGRPPRAGQVKPKLTVPVVRKVKEKEVEEDEDVCFICFDGGSLVLCDRRSCPKAYYPACIKRDEEFFQSAAKWNCGT